MADIFEMLFGDESSQLFTANLHAAWREQIIAQQVIRAFADATAALSLSTAGKPPRSIAMSAIFAHTELFQRAGPEIRPPRRDLINIRPLSQVHYSLTDTRVAPNDRGLMLADVRACILRRPRDVYGRADRLLWIAEQDDAIQVDVNALLSSDRHENGGDAKRLERVMLFYGLPVLSRTNYLITEFAHENWGSLASDQTYRRPTAFDAVDGDYFKQRRLRDYLDANEWNKTADLASILRENPLLGDGAWEAVGIPLQMARVKRTAVVLSSADAEPCDRRVYATHVKQAYLLAGVNWDNIPLELAETITDGDRDGGRG